jgi:hypothetical protein
MDYRQIEDYFRNPNFTSYQWFLVTKRNDGRIEYTAIWSHRNQQGFIVHERIPIVETIGEFGNEITFKILQ